MQDESWKKGLRGNQERQTHKGIVKAEVKGNVKDQAKEGHMGGKFVEDG